MERLFNSPIAPVFVPQLFTVNDVDNELSGNVRAVFQISQPEGPYAAPEKLWFFREIALEYVYPIKVDFRKVAVGSDAPSRTRLWSTAIQTMHRLVRL